MANNPKVQTIFYKANDEQIETLRNGGTITKDGNTFTASVDNAYLIPSSSVSFKPQSLTAEQKAQARTNIGAGTSSFSGSYDDLTNKPTIPTMPTTTTAGQLVKTTSTSGTFTSGNSLPYITTAPSAANTDGGLILVVLSSDPATRYAGYIYIITSSNS